MQIAVPVVNPRWSSLAKYMFFIQFDYMMLFEISHHCMAIVKEPYVELHKNIFSEITNLIEHTVHIFLSSDALSKGTIEVGVVCAHVPICFHMITCEQKVGWKLDVVCN